MTIANGTYRLRNERSNTFLDAPNDSSGRLYGHERVHDGNLNQRWKVQKVGGRFYTLQVVSSGLFMYTENTVTGTNVHVSQHTYRWTIKPHNGLHVILADDSNAVLDLDSGRTDNGATVNLWPDVGDTSQQKWIFERVSDDPAPPPPVRPLPGGYTCMDLYHAPGVYFIRNNSTKRLLDLTDGNASDGTPVVGWAAHGGQNQKWVFEPGERGYRIRNGASGTYLGFREGDTPRQSLTLSGNKRPVEWHIRVAWVGEDRRPVSQLYLVDDNTHLVADLLGGEKKDNAPVALWPNNSGRNQQWEIQRAGIFLSDSVSGAWPIIRDTGIGNAL